MAALDKTQLHLGHLLVIVVLSSARCMYRKSMGISKSSKLVIQKRVRSFLFPYKRCGIFKDLLWALYISS